LPTRLCRSLDPEVRRPAQNSRKYSARRRVGFSGLDPQCHETNPTTARARTSDSSGSSYENPAANFFRVTRDPKPAMEKTTQVFLGCGWSAHSATSSVRALDAEPVITRCRRSFPRWASARLRGREEIVYDQRADFDIKHPRTRMWSSRTSCGGDRRWDDHPTGCDEAPGPGGMVTSKDNPFFAKSAVNRVWSYFFGRGIIDPVDDIALRIPVESGAARCARERLCRHGFDLRHLMRTIANSRAIRLP